jgi:PAS domain S-box-containing protein
MFTVPWPALVSLTAGCGALYTVRKAWVHRNRPGGVYWIGFIIAIGVWSLTYGLALFVFDPELRRAVGASVWLAKSLVPPLFLGFALAYTGRTRLAYSRAAKANVALWIGLGLFEAINPLHQLMWRSYRIDPAFGAATVSLEVQPLLYGVYALSYLEVSIAFLLLLETLVQYGSVYRRQILALVVGAALPTGTTAVWLLGISPVPQLNLTPIAITVTVVAGYYALFRGELFDVSPSTQRAADRAALDDLGSAVVIVTAENRVVDLNATAERLFAVSPSKVLGRPLARLVDVDPGLLADILATDPDTDAVDDDSDDGTSETTVAVRVNGEKRMFKLSTSVLTDPMDRKVGYTLVFQDVTVERQREQRLQVLNRVLRHNLRNDMNVVHGYLREAIERVEDEHVAGMLETAAAEAEGLLALGEKARALERLMHSDETPTEEVTVVRLLDSMRTDWVPPEQRGSLTVRVPPELRLKTNADLFSVLFGNLVENAFQHGGESPNPEIELVDVTEDGVATFEVRDDGPGIPEHERAAVERGKEDPLQHGSSLGLWLVEWSATTLGGDVSFDADDGTTVRVSVPGVIDESNGDDGGDDEGGSEGIDIRETSVGDVVTAWSAVTHR